MNKFERLRQLRQKRSDLRKQADAILAKANTEKRGLTPEEVTQVEGFISDAAKHTVEIDPIEREIEVESRARALGQQVDAAPEISAGTDPSTPGTPEQRNKPAAPLTLGRILAMEPEARRRAAEAEFEVLGAVLRGHEDELTPEQRATVRNVRVTAENLEARGLTRAEQRAMLTSPGSYAGVLISPLLQLELLQGQREALGMLEAGCTQHRTATGADLPIPYNDDTGTRATILGEGKAASETSSSFGQKNIKVFKYTTGYFKISNELMQDSAYDLMGYLRQICSARFGRAWAEDHVTGNGVSAPEGIVTALDNVGSNAYVAAAANTAITDDDLWNLQMGVNPAYRASGCYMGSDEDYARVMKIKDSNGRYAFRPDGMGGAYGGGGVMIHGKPWKTLTYANSAALGASQTRILFGDPRAYYARPVLDMVLFRNDFQYMESGLVSFVAFARMGGGYPNPAASAATQPIKALRLPA